MNLKLMDNFQSLLSGISPQNSIFRRIFSPQITLNRPEHFFVVIHCYNCRF